MIRLSALIGFLLVLPALLAAQTSKKDSLQYFYWASFKDKMESPYSVEEPAAFLSPRAIERRERLNIPITPEDFPPNPEYLDSVRSLGGPIHHDSRWLNAATFRGSDSSAQRVAQLPFVDTVWQAGPYRPPRGARLSRGFKMDSLRTKPQEEAYYGYGSRQIQLLEGDSLHKLGYRGEGVLIAVLDGGFIGADQSPFFDSLRADGRLLPPMDIVDGDTMVWESSTHGTKVLSTMAADKPGLLVGTAPGASYICIKTEDTRGEHRIEECHWVAGIEYADSLGADLVNSSLGYTTFDDQSMDYDSTSLTGELSVASRAADIAAQKGMLVITSAGNEGSSSWRYIGIPADAEKALSVGATTLDGQLAGFSSVGLPGESVIKPDIVAPGAWVVTAGAFRYRVTMASGTSFASPITAGLVGCLRQAYPDKSVEEILEAVRRSSSNAAVPNYQTGYGLPNFYKAFHLLQKAERP